MDKKPRVSDANIFLLIFTLLFMMFQVILLVFATLYALTYGDSKYEYFFKDNIYAIIAFTQFGLILIPLALFILIKKLNIRETLRLNNPGLIPSIIIIFASLPAYAIALMLNSLVVFLLQYIGPIPDGLIPAPESLHQFVIALLFIAVTPAICEEAMHRGLLLNAYERRGTIKAIVISSLIFGIFHFDITNLLGPIFLGLLIAYYVIRTNSIFAGVLAHFMNNAIALTLQYFTNGVETNNADALMTIEDLFITIMAGVTGILFLSVFLMIFSRTTELKRKYIKPISSISKDIKSIITHWPLIIVMLLYVSLVTVYIITLTSV